MLFVVLNDFSDDEVEKLLGEFGSRSASFRQIFEPCDLCRFARWIGRGKVVFGFEFPHSLCVFEPLAQCIDKDRVQPVDGGAVLFQHFGGEFYGVGHAASFGWRQMLTGLSMNVTSRSTLAPKRRASASDRSFFGSM